MVSPNTTLIPSLGLRIGPACETGLSVGMRRERVPPQRRIRKKERTVDTLYLVLQSRAYNINSLITAVVSMLYRNIALPWVFFLLSTQTSLIMLGF